MMIIIMKTLGSQVHSPVAERNRKEGGGKKKEKAKNYVCTMATLKTKA